jgi:hypothetical protein
MAQQTINTGSGVNKGDGDSLRTSFNKVNNNFDELYAADVTISLAVLKTQVAASADFADFQARIAAL